METNASLSTLILDVYKNITPEKEYTNLKKTEFDIIYSNKNHTNCVVIQFLRLLGKPSTVVARDYRLFKQNLKRTYDEKINEWLDALSKTFKDFVVIDHKYLGIQLIEGKYNKYLEAKFVKNMSDYSNYSKRNLDTCYEALQNKNLMFFPTERLLELQNVVLQQIRVFNSDAYWLQLLQDKIK